MRKGILILLLFSVILGCKKSKPGDTPEPTPPVPQAPAPEKAVLTSPAMNEPCLSGVSVSALESSVVFSWTAAKNAESYDLVLKNLLTNATSTHAAGQTTLKVNLLKNTPYSWFVKAKTSKTTTVSQSDTWKFYNSGDGSVTYAPFPAEIISPVYAANLAATNKVTLKWTSSDVDNDIVSHAVYFGTSATPALFNESIIAKELDVTVTSNTTYYWRVVTRDATGNTSDSGIFQFKVN